MNRVIVLLHRYLGIALCLLVAAWCLSGIVMMYVGFPQFGAAERIRSLAPLVPQDCCDLAVARAAVEPDPIKSFELEMQAGRPVLLLAGPAGKQRIDLHTGAVIGPLEASEALDVARQYQRVTAVAGTARYLDTVAVDQWTVSGGYAQLAPLHRIALGDAHGTQLYVSAQTGQIAQRTTARERAWNYLGAVTHWLYFTPLRRHAGIWTRTVIAVSSLGVLLALAGIYLGIAEWRLRPAVRWTAHRGVALWHHLAGLLFGLLALAWIGSGLLSMNPWGLLESRYGADEAAQLSGIDLTAASAVDAVRRILRTASACNPREHSLQQLASAPLAGRLYVVATNSNTGGAVPSRRIRCDTRSLALAPLMLADLVGALRPLHGGEMPASAELLSQPDAFYYTDHNDGFVPAYRVVFAGHDTVQYYFDPVSGALRARLDASARGFRWLFNAVHRWDFSASMRQRPWWDLMLLALLAGVAGISLTAVVLAVRRVLSE